MTEPWDTLDHVPEEFPRTEDGTKWAEKLWLNVPGPFYTGETDTCWTGRLPAPRHVLYGGPRLAEFVYRQPKTPEEVDCLVDAAWDDPLDGYACDGDSRWTPDAVREWWRGRDEVAEHVTALARRWEAGGADPYDLDAAGGARDFLAYLAGELETDLRAYVFRLENGRYPVAGDRLPML